MAGWAEIPAERAYLLGYQDCMRARRRRPETRLHEILDRIHRIEPSAADCAERTAHTQPAKEVKPPVEQPQA